MSDAQTVAVGATAVDGKPPVDSALRVLAAVGFTATLLTGIVFMAGVVTMSTGRADDLNSTVAASLLVIGMTALALAGMVLARQQPRSTIAWLMISTALAWVLGYTTLFAALALLDHGHPAAAVVGWLTNWSWIPAQALSMVMLLRFPTGRLPNRRWRVAEAVIIGWAMLAITVTALIPGPLGAEVLVPLVNPIGWNALGGFSEILLTALFGVIPLLVVMSALAPIVRWRRAGARERAALRWIAITAVVLAVAAPLALLGTAGEIVQGLAFLLLPVAIAIAVLREQLWDIELRRRYDRLSSAREQERERLRHELHDTLGPLLGSISLRSEAARNLLQRGEIERVDEILATVDATTGSALNEVRRLIDDLGTTALHDRDLVPALRTALTAYADSFPVSLTVRPDPLPPLDAGAASAAYLVINEAIRNAARHSGGTHAEVRLRTAGDRLKVEIRDDGNGLGDAAPGIGRTGMARRVTEQGGRLRIDDSTGGTLVAFELPGARR